MQQPEGGTGVSVHISGPVWRLRLSATEKLVMLKLADCADDDGRNAFPGRERIALETGLAERSVVRALRSLEAQGLISIQAHHDRARHLPTTYTLHPERGRKLPRTTASPGDMVSRGARTPGDRMTPGNGLPGGSVSRGGAQPGDMTAPGEGFPGDTAAPGFTETGFSPGDTVSAPGDMVSRGRVTLCPSPGDTVSPDPSLIRQLDPSLIHQRARAREGGTGRRRNGTRDEPWHSGLDREELERKAAGWLARRGEGQDRREVT